MRGESLFRGRRAITIWGEQRSVLKQVELGGENPENGFCLLKAHADRSPESSPGVGHEDGGVGPSRRSEPKSDKEE